MSKNENSEMAEHSAKETIGTSNGGSSIEKIHLKSDYSPVEIMEDHEAPENETHRKEVCFNLEPIVFVIENGGISDDDEDLPVNPINNYYHKLATFDPKDAEENCNTWQTLLNMPAIPEKKKNISINYKIVVPFGVLIISLCLLILFVSIKTLKDKN